MYLIAFDNNSPTDSTVSCGNRFSSGIQTVSVTVTSLIGASLSRFTAGPESSACVAQTYTSFAPRSFQRPRGFGNSPRGIDHVVGEKTIPAFHFTDDVHNFALIRLGTPLVDDGE